MKKYNKILEAVKRGINIALDDFEDLKISTQKNSSIIDKNDTAEFMFFYDPIEKMKLWTLDKTTYFAFREYVKKNNKTYKAKDTLELRDIIEWFLRNEYTYEDDLNWIDTSEVDNMAYLFAHRNWCGDISKWNTSKVETMYQMFAGNEDFNCNISGWDVSNVENMGEMFYYTSKFNLNIGNWNVSNVKTTEKMFFNASAFDLNLSKWELKRCENRKDMFKYSPLDIELLDCYLPTRIVSSNGTTILELIDNLKKKLPKEYSTFEITAQLATDRENRKV